MKKVLKSFDLFPSPAILRSEGQTQVKNLCSGIFSLAILIGILTAIIISIINTLQFKDISATHNIKVGATGKGVDNMTMAVGLQWNNLTAIRNLFEVRAFKLRNNRYFTQISVFPCQRNMWSEISDETYSNLGLSTYLCIQKQNVSIYGQSGQIDKQLIFINFSICRNVSSPVPCATQAQIDDFFATRMIQNRFLMCSFAMLDVSINPTTKEALQYSVNEKSLWILFNQDQKMIVQLFLGNYHVTTDVSVLPYEQIKRQDGHFIQQVVINPIMKPRTIKSMAEIYIFQTYTNIYVDRKIGKVDYNISYFGGLLSFVISFLAFFMLSFNKYRYQLQIGEAVFNSDSPQLTKCQQFTYFRFIKYSIFIAIKSIFRNRYPKWRDCQAIQKVQEQANAYVGTKDFLKRIAHIQRILSFYIDPNMCNSLYLLQQSSLDKATKKRSIMNYIDKFSSDINERITIRKFQQIQNNGQQLNNIKVSQQPYNSNSIININQTKILEKTPTPKPEHQYVLIDRKRNQNSQSLKTLQHYLNIYKNREGENQRGLVQYSQKQSKFQDLDEQLEKLEKEICQSFFSADEEVRVRVIRNIPIEMLYRFWMKYYGNLSLPNKQLETIANSPIEPVVVLRTRQKPLKKSKSCKIIPYAPQNKSNLNSSNNSANLIKISSKSKFTFNLQNQNQFDNFKS